MWVLARTDRDGSTHEEVLQSGGAVLTRFLGQASPLGQRTIFEVLQSPKGDEQQARFIIGAARPVLVTAKQDTRGDLFRQLTANGLLQGGRELGYHTDCAVIRTVKASQPWYVVAEFDWRAPAVRIPWPRRKVNLLGFPEDADQDLDWLLLAAAHQGPAREKDTDLISEVSDETAKEIRKAKKSAERAVSKAVKPLLWGASLAAGAGLVWYLTTNTGKRRAA